ncbi:MAG: hypothetical protein E7645_06125 [Ruminococcaceae bacterium]|nr:hypothetical protein [Oscillospiraceae bacterium]
MQFRKIMCIVLAVLMLAGSLVACGEPAEPQNGKETQQNKPSESKDNNSSDDNSTNEAEVETTDPVVDALNRLTDINWGDDEFTVLYASDIGGYSEEVEAEAEASNQTSSAVINDAVYERNILLEDLCHLQFLPIPSNNAAIVTQVSAECQTNTGDYDLVSTTASSTANMATSGYLYNYLDMDIDYEQPWWDPGTLDFALDGKVFFMNGAHNIVDDDVTFVFMFNKTLQNETKVPDPYTTVRNKEWTLDHFNTIIQNVSADANGDGTMDHNDRYGFSSPGSIGNTFFYGAGLQYVANNRSMDYPELVLGGQLEKAAQVLSKAQSIVHDNDASYVAKAGDEALSRDVFVEERALFYCEAASYLRALNQTMEGDYGVVPVPKYSKEQENYLTWTHGIGSTLSMPTSIVDEIENQQFEEVLEAYVVLSYKLVKPAYYDTMLTSRNVRDPDSAEMLDIIFQNRTYDMAIYFDALGFSSLFADCVINNTDNFSSKYSSNSKRFDRTITQILKKLNQ